MTETNVALVSGCSSGVGLHTAVRLAEAGFHVIATLRDTAKAGPLLEAAKAAGVEVEVAPLDVTDQASINAAVADAMTRLGRIDLLVNNAGGGFLGSVEQTSDADLRRVMELNFFGVWNLTKAVLPLMRAAGSGRIVTVTSVGGLLGQPFNEAYCAAKFAVEGMMEGLVPLARNMGIEVCLVEPGPILTEFVNNVRAMSASSIAGMTAPYDRFAQNYMGSTGDVFTTYGQSGDDIAQIIAHLATAQSPAFRTITSEFAKTMVAAKVVDPTGNSIPPIFTSRLAGKA